MEAIDSRVEVKGFDHSKLKHIDTEEKNSLPDAQSKFSASKLWSIVTCPFKHVKWSGASVMP